MLPLLSGAAPTTARLCAATPSACSRRCSSCCARSATRASSSAARRCASMLSHDRQRLRSPYNPTPRSSVVCDCVHPDPLPCPCLGARGGEFGAAAIGALRLAIGRCDGLSPAGYRRGGSAAAGRRRAPTSWTAMARRPRSCRCGTFFFYCGNAVRATSPRLAAVWQRSAGGGGGGAAGPA
jgi:hypothetical protein